MPGSHVVLLTVIADQIVKLDQSIHPVTHRLPSALPDRLPETVGSLVAGLTTQLDFPIEIIVLPDLRIAEQCRDKASIWPMATGSPAGASTCFAIRSTRPD